MGFQSVHLFSDMRGPGEATLAFATDWSISFMRTSDLSPVTVIDAKKSALFNPLVRELIKYDRNHVPNIA